MRLVTCGAACSLDGFIARADGGVDWLVMTEDAQRVMAESWSRIDTVLMGRKTWEAAVASAQSARTEVAVSRVISPGGRRAGHSAAARDGSLEALQAAGMSGLKIGTSTQPAAQAF